MLIFLAVQAALCRRHGRRHRSATNQETSVELLSADAGDLKGLRLGPQPRFRRYRTARFLQQLLQRVQYEKNLAAAIEREGATGMERLMRETLLPVRPFKERGERKLKKWAAERDTYTKQMDALFDRYTKNPFFLKGVPFKKDPLTSF